MTLKCSCCGKELNPHESNFIITSDKELVCTSCLRNSKSDYKECRVCRRYFKSNGEDYCPECLKEIFEKPINPYSTKIIGIFDNKNNKNKCLNNRYYGLEMEFNNISPSVMRILLKDEYENHKVYGKSDGSISCGVEVVTVPMDRYSVNTFLDRIKDNLKELDNDYTSRGAGLHIHVSRNSIPAEVIRKLATLFNYKTDNNSINSLYYLCGRQPKDVAGDSYYRAGSFNNIKKILEYSKGHSVAFNNANIHTVEFRIFKSINDTDVLKMYVDIVDSAINFCTKNGYGMININNFLCYLALTTNNELIKSRLRDINSKYNVGLKVIPNTLGIANLLEGLLNNNIKDYNEMENKLKNNRDLYNKVKEGLVRDIIKGEKKCV